jgi:hypothetical protein
MRHLLFALYTFACLALLGCSSPAPTPTPAPDHAPPIVLAVQGSGACPDGSSTWSPDPSVRALPVPVDLTSCSGMGSTQAATVACVQSALDGAIDAACIASVCCLSRGEWVAQLDHGMGQMLTSGGSNRRLFWLQLSRKRPEQLDTVWQVAGLDSFADVSAANAATLDALRPPDCTGGADAGACSSLYLQVPMFSPRLGPWDLLITGWVDARIR